ncbi:hypothetical protein [Streptomyces sp. NBC_00996]
MATARAPVERGVTRLKAWRIFRRPGAIRIEMPSIDAALHTLERQV